MRPKLPKLLVLRGEGSGRGKLEQSRTWIRLRQSPALFTAEAMTVNIENRDLLAADEKAQAAAVAEIQTRFARKQGMLALRTDYELMMSRRQFSLRRCPMPTLPESHAVIQEHVLDHEQAFVKAEIRFTKRYTAPSRLMKIAMWRSF
jgi:hypothetical protein